MALVGCKLFFISVLKIRRGTLFVVYFMELLVALSYSRGSCFFLLALLVSARGFFLLVAGLAMSLGPRRRRTEEEREKNTQTLNHTVCEDLPFSKVPQG